MDKSRPEYREGKRRLKNLMGRAKAEIRKNSRDIEAVPQSMLGMSIMEHATVSKIDSLVVYEEGAGKWYADIHFKSLPIGVPTVFGTPVSMPKASKQEAEKEAYFTLVMVLAAIKERETVNRDSKLKDKRVFELFGFSFSIDGEAVDQAAALALGLGMGEEYTLEAAENFLNRAAEGICGDQEFSGELFDASPREKQARLMAAMSLMMLLGEFRYPRREGAEKL